MGLVLLLQEETGVPGKNLRCSVVRLDNILLTCDKDNFNHTENRINEDGNPFTEVTCTCTTAVSAAPLVAGGNEVMNVMDATL